MKNYYVYIIKCSDKSYYVGITNNIERRIFEHQEGIDPYSYTFKRRPIELMFKKEFINVDQAIQFEKQLKGWSRKKKEAIINNQWDKLSELSKNNQDSSTGSE
ncbi:putative endonuclease [Chishuiella changwenlii]|uniref:Endonuclease n=1 Tax=Chishuiella changwenlii TaxID=1434701 RepID=A0A1M6VXB6_9FLAO|nr:GIY-YIG nuclease family protein [Chishuiella changwenlii]GGE89665.1 endonuclease [Chishuiella changwenlii]SHK86143.1 putative endonuclease [Chishuiella changwenlii]